MRRLFGESPPPAAPDAPLRPVRARDTVRNRLLAITLFTTTMALLVAGTAMLTRDLTAYRHRWAADLDTQAAILALSATPALAFDDRQGAQRSLATLDVRRSVQSAALYLNDGRRYATYAQPDAAEPPLHLRAVIPTIRVDGEVMELTRPIVNHGERLGTLYLRATYNISGRVLDYLSIFGMVMLLAIGVALVLTAALRRLITAPLESMAHIAREVVTRRDFSLRAQGARDDEIGLVVRAFNSMLDEVQSRTRALEHSNAALQASERLYRAIGESIAYGVWVTDERGRPLYVSDSFLKLVGVTAEEFRDRGWWHALPAEERAQTDAAWRECLRSGRNWYHESRVRGADGEWHAILTQGVPIRAEGGRITGWAGINLDIGRLKRTEDALREADRRKDEFLATLAHELRNPLAPITHAVRLLEARGVEEQSRQWARDVIARQVRRMALLLDDLLEVSRITRGRLELRREPVDLGSIVAAAVETARPLIEARGHELVIDLPEQTPRLSADPLRLSQALSNLLTNAAKYTDPGGRITLRATLERGGLRLAVRDTGIGLSAEAIPNLFEMFSQLEPALQRSEGGLGIGLALVKGLTELHGGRVAAHSDGPGTGSTFVIELPRSILMEAGESGSSAPGRPAAGPGRRLLVADDNREAADALGALLELSGHRVHVAHSGHEALEIALRERPHCMILDIGMPDLSGYELAERIRREGWGRDCLLVAVTGWGQQSDKTRARAAGFDHHLTKPVDSSTIEKLLHGLGEEKQAS